MDLQGTYRVRYEENWVGTVDVVPTGLYYEIICNCRVTGERMLELVAEGQNFQENLGLLVPVAGGFGLKKRIPMKQMGEKDIQFSLRSRLRQITVMVDPDKPFDYLQQLDHAYLAGDEKRPVIVIRKNLEKNKNRA